MNLVKFLSVILLSSIVLISCGTTEESSNNNKDTGQGTMTVFTNEDELEAFLKEQIASAVVEYSFDTTEAETDTTGGSGNNSQGQGNSDGSQRYSDTNVQESGVDESDKIKTDGNYLYLAQEQAVKIIKLDTNEGMSVAGSIAARENIESLHLYGSILVALYLPADDNDDFWCGDASAGGTVESLPSISVTMPCWIGRSRTGVLVINVKDPLKPERIKDLIFDGELVSSRLINGLLHIISRFRPTLPPLEYYYDRAQDEKSDVVRRNLDALKDVPLHDLVPSFELFDKDGKPFDSGLLVSAEDFMKPGDPQGSMVVSITTLDLNSPEVDHESTGAVLDAIHVYASTSSLYLASEIWNYNVADEDIVSAVQTAIHKFNLTGKSISFSGSGLVPGSILNQFSFGEYKDILRVATSSWNWNTDSGGERNNVYCLKEDENKLAIIGRLENLAPGEHLYAARFIGDKGYLVTFEKVDPLFTLDLSDPSDPELMGELKVPGYSDYIHPLGDNHLLTIGKDAIPYESWSYYQGLQLTIFDVTDFKNPVLLHKEPVGDRGTESEALHNHKAFTYWSEKNLLAIPIDLYEHQLKPQTPWERGIHVFSGLYVYRVKSDDGFSFLGRISTSNSTLQYDRFYSWSRGLFLEDRVYAITPDTVNSAAIDDINNTMEVLPVK
ncbi:MAG: beta-propeller domain-containing protein [Nitrospiraceae bacterium]|nr:MAG: beta-propeller domain-containing protein [Nitrospiraceae bacterium]